MDADVKRWLARESAALWADFDKLRRGLQIMSEEDERLSVAAAAELLGVHPQTLRRYTDQGRITSTRLPSGQRRYRRGDVEALRDAVATDVVVAS